MIAYTLFEIVLLLNFVVQCHVVTFFIKSTQDKFIRNQTIPLKIIRVLSGKRLHEIFVTHFAVFFSQAVCQVSRCHQKKSTSHFLVRRILGVKVLSKSAQGEDIAIQIKRVYLQVSLAQQILTNEVQIKQEQEDVDRYFLHDNHFHLTDLKFSNP